MEILPLPEYVIALGETLEAAGNPTDARKQYDLARAQIALLQAGGVVVDLDLALFEADHGDAATALMLAEAAYAGDADGPCRRRARLGPAPRRPGRRGVGAGSGSPAARLPRSAVRTTTPAPSPWPAATRSRPARHLEAALQTDPGFSATDAVEARRLLDQIES